MSRMEDAKELRALLAQLLKQVVPSDVLLEIGFPAGLTDEETTFEKVIALRLIENACKGDNTAIRDLLDRLYGKPVQTNENINANLSYYDFLKTIAEREGMVIDAVATPVEEPKKVSAPRKRIRAPEPAAPAENESDILGDL